MIRRILVSLALAAAFGALRANAQSAISYVTSGSAQAASVAIAAHNAGDLGLLFCHRDGSTTQPTAPAGWTKITGAGANSNSAILATRVLDGTESNTGTCTNATSVAFEILRGAVTVVAISNFYASGAVSGSIAYGALTLKVRDNTSWLVGFAGHRSATNAGQAPAGMTLRSSATDVAASDSNGPATSWSAQSVTVNASSGWRSYVVEVTGPCPSGSVCADTYVDMSGANVGDALRATADADNLPAGTRGANGGVASEWTLHPDPLVNFAVAAHDAQRTINLPLLMTDGSTLAAPHTTHGWSFDNTQTYQYVEHWQPANLKRITAAGFITENAATGCVSNCLADRVRIPGATNGKLCILQLDSGPAYSYRIETTTTSTNHSAAIPITRGHTYAYSLSCDWNAGASSLSLWDASNSCASLGTVRCAAGDATCPQGQATGDTVGSVQWGNDEVASSATTTYFENMLLDTSRASEAVNLCAAGAPGNSGRKRVRVLQ